jgi:septum formation protein
MNPVLYLASRSPRRRELLRQLGVPFTVVEVDVSEHRLGDEPAEAYAARLARDKALAAERLLQARNSGSLPILGADTCVVLDGDILGKPVDRNDAAAMLARLSGRSHEVVTAIYLVADGQGHADLSISRVTFANLGEADIAHYWDSGEPRDKAGAYAIQGRAAAFVSRIEGSYSGVVGLPLHELSCQLRAIGIEVP